MDIQYKHQSMKVTCVEGNHSKDSQYMLPETTNLQTSSPSDTPTSSDVSGSLTQTLSIGQTIEWLQSSTDMNLPEILQTVRASTLPLEEKNSLESVLLNLQRDKKFMDECSAMKELVAPPLTTKQDRKITRNINRMKKDLGYDQQAGTMYGIKSTLETAMSVTESLEELMDKIENLVCKVSKPDFVDGSVKRVEQFLLALVTLNQQTSYIGTFGVILSYVSTLCDRSMTKVIMEEAKRLIPDQPEFEEQSGWLTKNWKSLSEGPFGSAIGKIISLLIAVGFLPAKATTNMGRGIFELLKVRRFSDDGSSFPQLIDCITSTIDWVIDMAWPAAASGNFSLLLRGEKMHDLDDEYRKVVDCVDLYLSASYALLRKKHDIGDSGFEVIELIDKCIETHTAMKRDSEMTPFQKAELEKRLCALNRFSNGIQSVFKESTIRIRPYAFLLKGGSGVNKTGLNSLLIHVINMTNGFPEGDQYHCHFNEADQYMSTFEAKHISATFDDIGNSKPERETVNPLFKIIQFINNMHCTAMAAEAHLKGKKDINVKIVSATTNTVDIHANYFSCNPSSIMSRFNLVIDVQLKEEAIDHRGKIKEAYIGDLNPDMWKITANWVKVTRLTAILDKWCLIPYEEVTDLVSLMEFVATDSKHWFRKQDKLVDAAKAVHKAEHCCFHPIFALPCLKCGLKALPSTPCLEEEKMCSPYIEECATSAPTIADDEETFRDAFTEVPLDLPTTSERQRLFTNDMFIQDSLALIADKQVNFYDSVKLNIARLRDHIKEVDPAYVAMATAASVLSLCLVASSFYKTFESQASVEDVNAVSMPPEIVANRDNAYQKAIKLKNNFPEASMTATQQQFVDKLDISLMLVKVYVVLDHVGTVDSEYQCVASFPVGGGRWVLPYHIFKKVSPVGQFRLDYVYSEKSIHKRFNQIVELEDVQRVASSDIACVQLTKGGCNYDFSKFLQPTETKLAVGTTVQILPKTATMVKADEMPSEKRILAKITGYRTVSVKGSNYYAVEYDADQPTFLGLCGAPIVTVGVNPMIIGFHTAGRPKTNSGAGAIMIRSDLDMVYQGIFLSEKSECPTEQLGTPFETTTNCKWKSPIHWIPNEADVSLEYHGQHNLATTAFKTKITPSILVSKLDEIGISKEHSGPLKTAETMARQDHLVTCAELLPPTNPKFLKLATADLKCKLRTAIAQSNLGDTPMKNFVHPLSYSDALNGVPGVSGFDPLPPNTAPGFGRTGPKWKLCIQDAIDQKNGGGCPRLLTQTQNPDGSWTEVCEYQFDDEKLDVRAKVEDLFRDFTDRVRPNVILKCNLKDEALPLAKVLKGKLRVFSGATMDFVIATRMLFSPLNVLMTQLPTLFESAVGVNAQGKDWDFIGKYIGSFGRDRIFGGDFAKYDQRMRSDFTITAMEILKDVMRQCEFPDELLDLVDGVACEICFPFYEVNGIFVQIDGSNPSGHPLTVILNGVVNCLLMRYCYYAMHFKSGSIDIPLFHEVIALITYGDDNIAGVSEKETMFNHLTVAKELSLLGMKYTMPDKDSEPVEFIEFENLDFLKRKFRVHEQTGTMIGALDVKSIYKSLTTTMKSKGREESEAQVMAGNIANALSELWIHGPEVFREHKAKFECLKEVEDGPFTVGTFWRDVTEEQCIERYNATTCAYEECLSKLNIPYEYQSEILQFTDINISPYRGIMMYYLSSCTLNPPREVLDAMFELSSIEIHKRKPSKCLLKYALCQRERKRRLRKRLCNEILMSATSLQSKIMIVRARYDIVRKTFNLRHAFKALELYWRLAASGFYANFPIGVGNTIKEFGAPTYNCVSREKSAEGIITYTFHLK